MFWSWQACIPGEKIVQGRARVDRQHSLCEKPRVVWCGERGGQAGEQERQQPPARDPGPLVPSNPHQVIGLGGEGSVCCAFSGFIYIYIYTRKLTILTF